LKNGPSVTAGVNVAGLAHTGAAAIAGFAVCVGRDCNCAGTGVAAVGDDDVAGVRPTGCVAVGCTRLAACPLHAASERSTTSAKVTQNKPRPLRSNLRDDSPSIITSASITILFLDTSYFLPACTQQVVTPQQHLGPHDSAGVVLLHYHVTIT
jgi:hypothetical protein